MEKNAAATETVSLDEYVVLQRRLVELEASMTRLGREMAAARSTAELAAAKGDGPLPEDPALLQQMIRELLATLAAKERELAKLRHHRHGRGHPRRLDGSGRPTTKPLERNGSP